jgi:putative ABC transport system permease protein
MSLFVKVRTLLCDLFSSQHVETDLDQKVKSDLELLTEGNLRVGLSPDEAQLCGIEQLKDPVREQRIGEWFRYVLSDYRFAIRQLRKSPAFTAIAIFTLALGIGACTVIFSVVYNVFFHVLPYKDFNRSVVFEIRSTASTGESNGRAYFSAEEFRVFREENHVFEDMIAYGTVGRLFYDDGKFTSVLPSGAVVTTNAFDYLGIPPLLGRTMSEEDGRPGAQPVFVMNYQLWQREFGGDPKILGKTFILRDTPRTLVGIMPARFNAFGASLWLPMRSDQAEGRLIGRLKAGVSMQAAGVELNAIAHRLQRESSRGAFPEHFMVDCQTMQDSLIGTFKKTLYALLAAVFLLLLIACSNVANLLLARAAVRGREIAMRITLGATRSRLIRQLLVESFVLAAGASAVGCGLAYFGLRAVVSLIPAGTLPEETVLSINVPVLFLTLVVTFLTTILCGLAPALHVLRGDLQPHLSGADKGTWVGSGQGKLRSTFVVAEVGLSVVLLISAGLLMRSFLILTRVDLGFNPKNVLYFELVWRDSYNFSWSDPASIAKVRVRKNSVTRQLLDRIRTVPGVLSAAECEEEPPLKFDRTDVIIRGKPHVERWEARDEFVSKDYFETLGVPLLRGRIFSEDDVSAARHVLVINQAFARQYFLNEDPIGRKVKLAALDEAYRDAPRDAYFEIVGVVANYKSRDYENPSWQEFPEAFIPYSVQMLAWRTFTARTSMDAASVLRSMEKEVQSIDPGVSIGTSGTLEGSLREFYRGPQFELVTLSAFSLIGLALVVIGVFSVMAYIVSLQTREIGIRMALGAHQRNILRLVLLNGLRMVAAGIFAGLLACCALTRFLANQIPGVSPTDPATFAIVVTIVVAAGITAILLPARRASRVDPMIALRYE